ncbi:MAG: hypothetical protein Kow0031_23790 [Anaerolineae bacterium]
MASPPNKPTNYRANRRRQERSLLYLTVFVLVVIGDALIWLIWGARAAILGGACLFGGAALIVGLWLLLTLLEKFVDD